MVLPLAVTLIIYNIYSMTALNRQAAQSAAGTGYIYEQFYEKSIKTVESYMISEMVGNDFRRLNYPLESLQAYLCGQNILEDFTKYLTSDVDGLVALEFYSESNDLLRIKHAPGTRYVPTKQSGICRAVYEEMKQGELNSDWYVIPVGDDYFLIRILKYGSMYIGAVMDFDQFMKPSSEVEGKIVLSGLCNAGRTGTESEKSVGRETNRTETEFQGLLHHGERNGAIPCGV